MQIQIYVFDINDNAPIIESYEDTIEIPEKSANGTNVVEIIAIDADRDSKYIVTSNKRYISKKNLISVLHF